MLIFLTILLSLLAGAAWRRWLGSARPDWAKRADGTDRPIGYRAGQIVIGLLVFTLILRLTNPWWWALLLAAAPVVFMSLPIKISRRVFEYPMQWLDSRGLLPSLFGDRLTGWAPWSELLQGAIVLLIAALVGLVF